jgi:DnaJ-class molecular chaperone
MQTTMTDLTSFAPATDTFAQAAAVSAALAEAVGTTSVCDECQGTGGWYRYEPALEAPGRMVLSCVHCRGSGRLARNGG